MENISISTDMAKDKDKAEKIADFLQSYEDNKQLMLDIESGKEPTFTV